MKGPVLRGRWWRGSTQARGAGGGRPRGAGGTWSTCHQGPVCLGLEARHGLWEGCRQTGSGKRTPARGGQGRGPVTAWSQLLAGPVSLAGLLP